MQEVLNRVDWEKSELLPVIVQDVTNNEVLMMAYMNREALTLALYKNCSLLLPFKTAYLEKRGV